MVGKSTTVDLEMETKSTEIESDMLEPMDKPQPLGLEISLVQSVYIDIEILPEDS